MKPALALLVAAAAGCAKQPAAKQATTDDCQRFVDRSRPQLAAMAAKSGKPLGDADLGKLVAKCREAAGKPGNKDDQLKACVLAAADDAAASRCWVDAMQGYAAKAQATEAKVQLTALGRAAQAAFADTGAFPTGKATTLPAAPCCASPDHRCPPTQAWQADPIWASLGFDIIDPTRFQYGYESDGKAATARAIGDLDCDGTFVTYRLELGVEGGNPTMKLVEPPADAD